MTGNKEVRSEKTEHGIQIGCSKVLALRHELRGMIASSSTAPKAPSPYSSPAIRGSFFSLLASHFPLPRTHHSSLITHHSAAFTLIEVIIAIGIVGVGAVAVMTATTGLSGGAAHTGDTVAAAALAGSLMAEINTRSYSAATPAPTGRVIQNLSVYYPFEDAAGTTASDASRITPPASLTIVDPALATWIPGSNGVSLATGGSLGTSSSPSKLYSACTGTNQLTVELWLEPSAIDLAECPIITLGNGPNQMDFILTQNAADLCLHLRTKNTNAFGDPETATAAHPLRTQTMHCVATFDGTTATIYVNAAVAAQSAAAAGALQWADHPLLLGKLAAFGPANWSGRIFLVALYSKALTPAEVQQNYQVGPSPSRLYNRTGYDDIDDYNGYADSPPRAEDGSTIVGSEAFSRIADVRNVLTNDLGSVQPWDSTDAKRISVSVYKNHKLLATLVRARYRGVSRDDPPDPGF